MRGTSAVGYNRSQAHLGDALAVWHQTQPKREWRLVVFIHPALWPPALQKGLASP